MSGAAQSAAIPEQHRKALQFIEDVTTNADEVQRRVLGEILTQNSGTEYFRRHGLAGNADIAAFKRLMPVIAYEDIRSDINRIANGDRSPILRNRPFSQFFASSATSSGLRKLFPTVDDPGHVFAWFVSLTTPVLSRFMPGLDKGKAMFLMFVSSESTTPGGLLVQHATTTYYRSRHFLERPFDPYNVFTSPNEAVLCVDSHQSMYSQLLCGLFQNTLVIRVGSLFAFPFLTAIRFLEKHWRRMVQDIRTGTLDADITDPQVREAVSKILLPNPDLADFVEAECRKQSWEGIIPRLWPNTKYVDVLVTGAMMQYVPMLEFYAGSLPFVSNIYGSSECFFGLNLNPLCKPSEIAYTLIPSLAYFEFLPVDRSDSSGRPDHSNLVDLVDVKMGQEYEVIVTTYAGLYRFQVGDIVRVAGFKNKAPQFTYVCRKNTVLSIALEKTDELELHNAVSSAISHLKSFGVTLVDYTSYADTTSVPGHYAIFWEVQPGVSSTPQKAWLDCCIAMEEALGSFYRKNRVAGDLIGPLELKIVEGGTFNMLMDNAVNRGMVIGQYKTPRCVTTRPMVELLNSRVVANYFSPRCPTWVPGHSEWSNT